MIPILSFVQEGQIPTSTAEGLRRDLTDFVRNNWRKDPEIQWFEVPEGNGFSGAEPSRASIISIRSDRALAQDERVTLMKSACDIWMSQTNCSIDEIVVSITDPIN